MAERVGERLHRGWLQLCGRGGAVSAAAQQRDCSPLLRRLSQPCSGAESQDSEHISQVVSVLLNSVEVIE